MKHEIRTKQGIIKDLAIMSMICNDLSMGIETFYAWVKFQDDPIVEYLLEGSTKDFWDKIEQEGLNDRVDGNAGETSLKFTTPRESYSATYSDLLRCLDSGLDFEIEGITTINVTKPYTALAMCRKEINFLHKGDTDTERTAMLLTHIDNIIGKDNG